MDRNKQMDSVAGKLKAFGEELPEQEKKVLDWLLERSAGIDLPDPSELALGELSHAAGGAPLGSQLAEQFGLSNLTADTVMWSHTFSNE